MNSTLNFKRAPVLLLGLKPVPVRGQMTLEYKVEVEHYRSGDPSDDLTHLFAAHVRSVTCSVFFGERLYATTTRFIIKKETDGDKVTVRLFKKHTTLH